MSVIESGSAPSTPSSLESASPPRWWRSWSIATVVFALVLRAAWGAVVPVVPESDCVVYDSMARNIVSGQGYAFEPGKPSAYWPVGTSAMLAGVYKVFGQGFGYAPVVVLNVLIGTATVWLTMEMARRWFGAPAGLTTGLLMAVWPGQIQFSTILASELPFNVCVMAALFAESRDRWRPAARAVTTGVALAAASYVRPLALLLPAVLVWCRLVGPETPRRRPVAVLLEGVAVVAVMAVLIAPWTLRNARAFGRPVLISTNGGPNLWMGNNPETNHGYMPLPPEVKGMNEVERENFLKDQARKYILENPGAFAVGLVRKLILLHDRENIGVVWNQGGLTRVLGPGSLTPLKMISSGYWWGAMLLAVLGVGVSLSRLGLLKWLGLAPWSLWLYFGGGHAVAVGGDRYHYPSVPMIAALAGLAVVVILDRVRQHRASASTSEPGPAA